MGKPLVSVAMPAYNCEKYIGDALRSITDQTYTNLEIIVVDDCSTDGTWEIIQSMARVDSRIKAVRNTTNLKISRTLNVAIGKSRGKYVARMDGDDERLLDSIEKQVKFLEENPEVVVVGGTSYICDENMNVMNSRRYYNDDTNIRRRIFRFSPFTHATIMMRTKAIPKRPYRLDWAEDYDLYFRLGNEGAFANLSDPLYKIRTHKASVSRTKARYQEKLTLYIRIKAVFEYGYTMSLTDKIYFVIQYTTMFIMPSSLRFGLFNKIRRIYAR